MDAVKDNLQSIINSLGQMFFDDEMVKDIRRTIGTTTLEHRNYDVYLAFGLKINKDRNEVFAKMVGGSGTFKPLIEAIFVVADAQAEQPDTLKIESEYSEDQNKKEQEG